MCTETARTSVMFSMCVEHSAILDSRCMPCKEDKWVIVGVCHAKKGKWLIVGACYAKKEKWLDMTDNLCIQLKIWYCTGDHYVT